MEQFRVLTSNYLINVGVLSWFTAQVIKTVLYYVTHGKLEMERMVGAGGMPSAHSALVCSITVGMAKKMGFASPEFALALAFAGVVMYDAMGVRRAAGEQAKVLNKMISSLNGMEQDGTIEHANAHSLENLPHSEITELKKDIADITDNDDDFDDETEEEKSLKEYLGHTPLEVLGGALLGILVAMLVPLV